MNSLIKSKIGIGQVQLEREKLLREEIIERYQHIGGEYDEKKKVWTGGSDWLEGLKEGNIRDNIAILYENTAKALYTEGMDTQAVAGFETVVFPMVRRVFSKLLVNELVSVQAMTQPSGALFFFNPKVSERVAGTDDLSRPTSSHAPSMGGFPKCMVDGFNCPTPTFESCTSLYDRYYGEDFFDHSKGSFTLITATGSTVKLDASRCTVATNVLKVATDGSIREALFSVAGFEGRKNGQGRGFSARMNGSRGYEVDTEEFATTFTVTYVGTADILDARGRILFKTGDEIPFNFLAIKYGQSLVQTSISDICDENGAVIVKVDLTSPESCVDCPSVDGFIGMASGTTFGATDIAFTWRRYNDLENETEIGEVGFEIDKVTVSVTPRKLRARWTPELAQDIAAYQNIDAEAELTALMSEQVAMEIDREVLRDLKREAAWRLNWDYYGWKQTTSQKYTQKEWNETLITRINQVSAQIHKSTLRGGANFVVVSTEVAAILGDIAHFLPSDFESEDTSFNLGVKKIGILSQKYSVYVDPYAKASEILIGYYGGKSTGGQKGSILDTGYLIGMYSPVMISHTLTDPNTFGLVKGLMTRYAKKMVNNRYYGVVKVHRLVTFDTAELR